MTDSSKFVSWLTERIDGALAASTDAEQRFAVLDGVHRKFNGEGGQLFGAVVDSHLPALRSALGERVEHERTAVMNALQRRLLGMLGVPVDSTPPPAAPKRGFFARLFGNAPTVADRPATLGGVNPAEATALVNRVGLAFVPLLEHPMPDVRLAVANGLSVQAAAPFVRARLRKETDVEVATALVERVLFMPDPENDALLVETAKRMPILEVTVLRGRLGGSAETMRTLATTLATRLSTMQALADPHARSFPAERNELLINALDDSNPQVVAAAIRGVGQWSVRAAGPVLQRVAMKGVPGAIEALVGLAPELAVPVLVANAKQSPPRLEGLIETVKARLSMAQREALFALLPMLPPGAAADAVRAQRDKLTPTTGATGAFETLEAAAFDDPTDESAWLVLSDALQTAGDPRGEVIALAHAGQPTEAKLREALPQLAPAVLLEEKDPLRFFTFAHGLPKTFTLKHEYDHEREQAEFLAALVPSALFRFVDTIELGLTSEDGGENDWSSSLDVLVSADSPVRSLLLGAFEYPDEMEISWAMWGDVSAVWKLKNLQKLHLRGAGGDLGSVDSETLRELVIETGGLDAGTLAAVTGGSLPRLESLTVWTGDENYGATVEMPDLVTLFEALPPTVRHLGVCNSAHTLAVLELLPTLPVLERLKTLDLSKGVLRPPDVELIRRHAPAYAHLERIDLRENLLDDASAAALQALFPTAVVTDQRDDDGDDQRYVAVGE